MRRFPLGVTGAALALVGGLAAWGGRTLIAADSAGVGIVRTGAPVVRTSPRTAVRVKATGAPPAFRGLVVPLKQRGPTAGQLAAVGKAGQPLGTCPLQHTDVKADVAGFVATVTVTQKYSNPFKEPIEAIYTFPLPEDAAVDDMEMRIGERLVKGEIKRREEARQIYETAKAAGQAAALLDQERPNIFTQAVANVMPGQDVTITIRYVNTLKYDEGRYEFTFPMVVGPRYIAGQPPRKPGERGQPSPAKVVLGDPGSTAVVTDADKIAPPITPPNTRAGHDISLTMTLDTGLILGDVTSVSHDIDVTREGTGRATIRLASATTIPNKDFVLRYTVAGQQMQTGVIAHADGGEGYFTLVLQPPAAPKAAQIAPKEMVFVLDQTGSQMGLPIAKSKETMKHAIQRLNPNDTFQLIGFTTDVFPCFSAPVPATPANIQKALEFMEPLEGAGGTDILKAADFALRIPDDPKRLRIICFMTDGYVGNDMQIIDYVKKNRGRARMFPFGIGGSVNRFLIEGMAREGRGQAEIVTLDEPGPAAAEKFYRRIQNPVLLDPQVDWNGLPVEDVYPTAIPDVFSEGPIILKGRFTRPAEGDITVRGLLGGQPWEQKVHVVFPVDRQEGAGLESLWARARLEDLQARDWLGAQTGNPNPQIKEEIVQTALSHRLMSQYTSFVAVEKKVINEGGQQRTVDVPVEMPEGVAYEGIFGKEERLERSARLSVGTATSLYAAPARQSAATLGIPSAPAIGGGGFGGTSVGVPPSVTPPPPPVAAKAISRAPYAATLSDEAVSRRSESDQRRSDLAAGKKDAYDKLGTMEPAERLKALREAKLAESLRDLDKIVRAKGKNGSLAMADRPVVSNGRVRIEIAVNRWPKDLAARLKTLGFLKEKQQGVVLTGTLPVAKLDALIAEAWVREVSPA